MHEPLKNRPQGAAASPEPRQSTASDRDSGPELAGLRRLGEDLEREIRAQKLELARHENRLTRNEARARRSGVAVDDLRQDLARAWSYIERQQRAIETLEQSLLQLAGRLNAISGDGGRTEPGPELEPVPVPEPETEAEPEQTPLAASPVTPEEARGVTRRGLGARILARLPRWLQAKAGRRLALRILRTSPFFDGAFYRRNNPDIGDLDPAWHYVARGATERRDPHPLFHTSYYLNGQPDVARAGANPLVHFIRYGRRELRDPFPLFESSFYVESNPDVAAAGALPFDHFVRHGIHEGRASASPERWRELIAPFAGGTGSEAAAYLDDEAPARQLSVETAPAPRERARAPGNTWDHELEGLLREGLRRHAAADAPKNAEAPRLHILVGPHRYDLETYPGELESTTVLNTAPAGSAELVKSLPWLLRAKRVLDLDYQTAALLRELGVPAFFLPLSPVEGLAPYGAREQMPDEPATRGLAASARAADERAAERPLRERPLDISFTGARSPRRERFLSEAAPLLGRYDCFLHLDEKVSLRALAALGQRAKIVINVHANGIPVFDWHRLAMLGLWQGALVVTEHGYSPPGLEAGRHFLAAERGELPALLRWLLETDDGMHRAEIVSAAGRDVLRRRYRLENVMERVAALAAAES